MSLVLFTCMVGLIIAPNISTAEHMCSILELIELKKKDYWVIGADIRGENINSAIFDQYMDEKIVLVLGSENKGISNILKKNCDLIARINNPGNTDSLNVSVASGIFLNRFS